MRFRFLPPFARIACLAAAWATIHLTPVSAASNWTGDVVHLQPKAGEERPPVITAMAIHPAGQHVALGGDDHLVRIWDLKEHKIAMILEGHTDWVRTLSYSPRGDMLVTS